MASDLFKEYHAKLAKEGWLKALLCAWVVAFSVTIGVGIAFWYFGVGKWWLCLVVLAGVTSVAAPCFYFAKFRPSTKTIARRIDELGLEERLLTMTELENDHSYIATKQREDALSALKRVNSRLIKFAISVPLIIACSVVAVFGVGSATVSALAAEGVIPSGKDLIKKANEKAPQYYEIAYIVEGNGEILGNLQRDTDEETKEILKIYQTVEEGKDATPVVAIADSGWVFVGWSDGSDAQFRVDSAVTKSMEVKAVFEELEDPGDPDPDDSSEGDGSGSGSGEDQKPGDPDDSENKGDNPPGDKDVDGNGTGNPKGDDDTKINNGEDYYGDELDQSRQDAVDKANDGNASEGDKGIIGDYFDIIKD